MNRHLGLAAFTLGLGVVGWVAWGYGGANPLALTMTALIAAFYGMGAWELRHFQRATTGLRAALAAVPEPLPHLADWLPKVPAGLQTAVRLRIEGERVGLPGPALTPYLVGLLVLLGMLGTFLGMVVTLNGAVMALESTTDLPTIRAALAAPVKGLGLAFGTSVAGVAASAMLGLMSALCRRDRLQAAQGLDTRIATGLRAFSAAHQREATLQALQAQAQAWPELAAQWQGVMAQMALQGQALGAQLLAGQERFHQHAEGAYTTLAADVGRSLQDSLTASARLAGATIQPVVEATMAGITRETGVLHTRLADTVQRQLDGVSARFDHSVTSVSETWREALALQQQSTQQLTGSLQQSQAAAAERAAEQSAALLAGVGQANADLQAGVGQAHADLQAGLQAQDQQRLAALTQSLEAMAVSLQQAWQQAGADTLAQQQQVCQTLEQTARDIHTQAQTQARSAVAEMAGLMHSVAEAPRAAAEVMALLREKLSDSLARDNALLDERTRLLETMATLLASVQQGATEQRGAIDALVASSAALLEQAGSRFSEQVEAEAGKISTLATQITGNAVEVASLGESFGVAVQLFSGSNEALVAQLQRIEAALAKSTARSDEQLAYYVAQAREIIDLSIGSQRQIVDDLQQLAQRPLAPAGEAA